MPIDYKKYPADWKTVIRPRILAREGHRCKQCLVPNGAIICRGMWHGVAAWQDEDGTIWSAEDGQRLGADYVGEVWVGSKQTVTKIVLTVAHLDHDVQNNEDTNLAALCQRCHLRHDKNLHATNARATRDRKSGKQKLF